MKRRNAATSIVFALGLALLAGCGGDDEDGSGDGSAGDQAREAPSFLFVAQAQSGTATKESGNAYALRLEGLGESVVAFSDRPERTTGNLSADRFFDTGWDETFADDPPNAALDLLEEGGSAAVSIFELKNPRLSGSSLTFDAELLDEASEGLSHYAGRTAMGPPARFDAASLFIDSGGRATLEQHKDNPTQIPVGHLPLPISLGP